MDALTPLRVGDVVEHVSGRRYHVIGFTSRGKTRVLRADTGTVGTNWWHARESLPRKYQWVMWMGGSSHAPE